MAVHKTLFRKWQFVTVNGTRYRVMYTTEESILLQPAEKKATFGKPLEDIEIKILPIPKDQYRE